MKQRLFSENLLFNSLFIIAVLVLPLFRIVSAIEFDDSNTDTILFPHDQLDNFALARFKDDNATSYSLVFWDRFAITVLKAPSSTSRQGSLGFKERIQQQLTIKPLNTGDSVVEAGVRFSRFDLWDDEYAIVVCELDKIYEGLTPVLMPFENQIMEFDQWFSASSSHAALSSVVTHDSFQQLLMVPLVFDPESYHELPGWVTAEHDGSTIEATEALNSPALPGMSCLGQNNDGHSELIFLGIKPDRQIYQYNKVNGDQIDQIVQIPFAPLERVTHLVATTAGISQGQSNRWHYSSDGSITLLSLSINDVLNQFGLKTDSNNEGYLCQSKCTAGTAPAGQDYCRTHKGKNKTFYVLEGRLVEWALVENGELPDHARYADADSGCSETRALCFVMSGEVSGFGEVDEDKGCNIGDGRGNYFDYLVPVTVSDAGATEDPEESTLPTINDTNSTADYSGNPHVIVITNPGFTEPLPLTPELGGSPPDLQPPGPERSGPDNNIVIIAVVLPAGIIMVAVVAGSSFYCYYKKPANTGSSDSEQNRLIEERSSPPPSPGTGSDGASNIPVQTLGESGGTTTDVILRSGSAVDLRTLEVIEPRGNTLEVHVEREPPPPVVTLPPVEGFIMIPDSERHVNTRPNIKKSKVPDSD